MPFAKSCPSEVEFTSWQGPELSSNERVYLRTHVGQLFWRHAALRLLFALSCGLFGKQPLSLAIAVGSFFGSLSRGFDGFLQSGQAGWGGLA